LRTWLTGIYLPAIERAPGGAYSYAENGEYSMMEICRSIGRMLGHGGKTASMTSKEVVVE
jgi:hypothetical protein